MTPLEFGDTQEAHYILEVSIHLLCLLASRGKTIFYITAMTYWARMEHSFEK
jgi:hypothetical protein